MMDGTTIRALTTSLGNERSSLHDLEQVAAADLHSLRPDHGRRAHTDTGIEDDDSIRTIDPDFHDNHNGLDISVSFDMSSAAAPGFDSADTIVPGATPDQAAGRPSVSSKQTLAHPYCWIRRAFFRPRTFLVSRCPFCVCCNSTFLLCSFLSTE